MKRLFISLFFLTNLANSQVLISPYIIHIDNKLKVGSYIVQNESNEVYEVNISFVYGYPISDSTGKLTMHYIEHDSSEVWSIAKYARAFPRKFFLHPHQKQVVRITIKAPDTLNAGTYWTRIVTSAIPSTTFEDTSNSDFKARIKFQINQVTTCLYRVEPAETGINIENVRYSLDSNKIMVFADLKREGNSPFFGNLIFTFKDSLNNVLHSDTQYIPVYFELTRSTEFTISREKPITHLILELTAFNTEKVDIPESKILIRPVIKREKEIRF